MTIFHADPDPTRTGSVARPGAVAGRPASQPPPRLLSLALWTAAWLAAGVLAAAAQDTAGAASDVVFLTQIMVLMLGGRLLGEAMQRLGQPSIMGPLIAGILLGPSVFGLLWPELQQSLFPADNAQKAMLNAVSQFGILLLLLLTGMETDLKLMRKFGRAAISVSLSGIAVPFACGFALGALMPQQLLPGSGRRLVTALFLGTALSISSIKIVAAIVREMDFTRRNLGQVIVSSSIIEDTIGWIIIAITLSLASAKAIDLAGIAASVIGTAAFLAVSFTVGRRIVALVIRFANDHFESEFAVISAILGIMAAMALTTYLIGVNTVLGAFISGVLIGESPILTRHIDEQLRGLIFAFFMPVFFGVVGLGTDLSILKDPLLLAMTLGLIAVASLGKFAGAFLGGEIGGLTRREALALAFAMNARGSTEVIVASIGLSMGALTHDLFTMVVAMALVTTLAMPPMLRWGLSRVPMSETEKARLAREDLEARGFLHNVERLLLAADESPNGRFASRLAGLVAGMRGVPITVLPLAKGGERIAADRAASETAERERAARQAVSTAAGGSQRTKTDEDRPDHVDVTVRWADSPPGEAVAEEARKGYDLLFVGLERTRTRIGTFHRDVVHIVSGFDGPLAIVEASGRHHEEPERSALDILVPVNGTEVSRRGAEVAVAIARGAGATLKALYVSEAAAKDAADPRRGTRERRRGQTILKDIVALADQEGLKIETAVEADDDAEEAIISTLPRLGSELIVMGASRRVGEPLFFGDTVAAVFENTPASILLISS